QKAVLTTADTEEHRGSAWDQERSFPWLLFHEKNLFRVVDLSKLHFDHFIHCGRYCAPDEAGLDWQLAVTAVNEHTQLHASRAALIEDGIQRGSNRAAGKENIVDKNNIFVFDWELDRPFLYHRLWADG